MSAGTDRSLKVVWWILGLPPVLFLIAIVIASIVVASMWAGTNAGSDPNAIAVAVSGATPWLLLGVQLALLGLLWAGLRASGRHWRDLGWLLQPGQTLWREVALGAGVGLALAVAYFTALSPLMIWAQVTVGDYVPAGELLPSLGGALVPFFLANVVLAPLVEEGLYRGLALPRLVSRFGQPVAIALNCFFFGLLHWTGGVWYVLLTGLIAGGLFGGLTLWRRGLTAAYAAHLALNAAEFVTIAWMMAAA